MNYLSNYDIQFSGLGEGVHLFDFSAGKLFFEQFEESEITEGNIHITVELEKRSTYLKLNFIIYGEVELNCDRCLENYMQQIKGEFPIYVKFTDTPAEDSDEIIYLHTGEYKINVAKLIYEFIVVSVPIRHIHPDNEMGESLCNPEMLKKIEEYRVPETDDNKEVDPRWNELRKIMGN